jgi:dUTP pyrophosphatase
MLIETDERSYVEVKIVAEDPAFIPKRMSENASGYDMYSTIDCTLGPRDIRVVPTGVQVELQPQYELQIRPRSGLARNGVLVLNSPGTIDADYRGEIGVILMNIGTGPYEIKRGDRIAQMVVGKTMDIDFTRVSSLTPTKRGTGGFGHTGK